MINYVVRRRYSGYVGGIQTQQAFTTGFNNSAAYCKYNYRKSEFSLSYNFNYRDYDKRRSDRTEDYYCPDGTSRHREYHGYDSLFMYNVHNFQLDYNLAEPDKYTFNARFNLEITNNPHRRLNQLAVETGQSDLYQFNQTSSSGYTPVIDLYYSAKLKHGQSIAANVVETYIHTDYDYLMRQYLFSQSPSQSMQADPVNDYCYTTLGKKYLLIAEAIYSKDFKKAVLSAGDGNVNLTPYTACQTGLTATWSTSLFRLWLNGGLYYAPDIIMSNFIPEQQADGSYIITSRPENQRAMIQKWARAGMTVNAIRDVLDFYIYEAYQHYDSRGLTYRHKYDAWLWGAEASLMLGPWTVSANFYNTPKSFYEETMNGGENTSDLNVMYRWKNLHVGLGAILVGYPQSYEYP